MIIRTKNIWFKITNISCRLISFWNFYAHLNKNKFSIKPNAFTKWFIPLLGLMLI